MQDTTTSESGGWPAIRSLIILDGAARPADDLYVFSDRNGNQRNAADAAA